MHFNFTYHHHSWKTLIDTCMPGVGSTGSCTVRYKSWVLGWQMIDSTSLLEYFNERWRIILKMCSDDNRHHYGRYILFDIRILVQLPHRSINCFKVKHWSELLKWWSIIHSMTYLDRCLVREFCKMYMDHIVYYGWNTIVL